MKARIFLVLIIVFSLFLRVYRLDRLELFGDELDVGYQAYSLLKTGKDYLGNKFPVYIHSFSEWRAPLLMYAAIPSVAVFGLNEWGVRLPAVFFGVLSIFLIYLLVKRLSKDNNLALISALLISVTPWHIHYSRTAFEATLLLSLVLLGTVLFFNKRWFLSFVFFAFSLYAYNTANIFVPLLILVLIFINRKSINFSKFMVHGLIFMILIIPLILKILSGQGSGRFKLISIFNNPQTIDQIVFKRNTGLENGILERFFHNKLTGWGEEFLTNYLTAFSSQFLFLTGDPNSRHNLPGFGEIYWVLAPFLILGVWRLLKSKEENFKVLIFSWLFLAPLPSSLTIEGGNQATRLFLMLPPLVILIALGVSSISSKIFLFIVHGSVFIILISWFHSYFVHYPKEQFQYWHYGYKEAFAWLRNAETGFEKIVVNNRHEPALIRYLFWTRREPKWFQENFQGDENDFSLGKINFIRSEIKDDFAEDTLYLIFQKDEVPGDWNWEKESPTGVEVLKTVYNPWGEPLMYWVAKKI